MGNAVDSASVLMNMLVELRQENRHLAAELSTARVLLGKLHAAAAESASGEGHEAVRIDNFEPGLKPPGSERA